MTGFFLVATFLAANQMRGRLEIWPDRIVVRGSRSAREYRFCECSDFQAVTLPTLQMAGQVVAFTHSPGGEMKHRVYRGLVGYNTLLPRYRGGAKRLANCLNQIRGLPQSGSQAHE